MKKYASIILFFATNILNSQNFSKTKHEVAFLFGNTNYTTYEPILSSVRQSSNLLTSGFEYNIKNITEYELGFKLLFLSEADLTSRLSNNGFRAPNTGEIFGGSFQSFYRILIKKTSLYMYVGLHLNGFYYDKSLDVISFDDARAADLFLDLGPSFSIIKDFKKHQLRADIGLPLIGYIAAKTRNSETFPFDLIDRDKDIQTAIQFGDLTFIDSYFNLNFNAEYLFKISEKLLLGLQYGFQYYNYNKETPFKVEAVSYQFLLQAKFRF